MGTRLSREEERTLAIARCLAGEAPTTVAALLGRSRRWLSKWLARHVTGGPDWTAERSWRPRTRPLALPARGEEAVRRVRLEWYNEGLPCGARNIRWRLAELDLTPVPALRTIHRILARHGLTHRRTGRYVPKGKVYPALAAELDSPVLLEGRPLEPLHIAVGPGMARLRPSMLDPEFPAGLHEGSPELCAPVRQHPLQPRPGPPIERHEDLPEEGRRCLRG